LDSLPEGIRNPTIEHYAVSARCQLKCRVFRLIDKRMDEIIVNLTRCQAELLHGRLPSLAGALDSLLELEQTNVSYLSGPQGYPSCFDAKFNTETELPSDIPAFQLYLENTGSSIQRYRVESSRMIFLEYLDAAGSLSNPPFQFEHTIDTIRNLPHFSRSKPCSHFSLDFWEYVVDKTVDNFQARSDSGEWADWVLGMMLSLWVPDTDGRIVIPDGLVEYLNTRKLSHLTSFSHVSNNLDSALFLPAITNILSGSYADSFKLSCLTALWYYIPEYHLVSGSRPDELAMYDRTLAAVLSLPPSPASRSVAALLKNEILCQLIDLSHWANHKSGISKSTIVSYFNHPLLPVAPETITELPAWVAEAVDDATVNQSQYQPLAKILFQRINEGRLGVLTEFLETWNTAELPFEAGKTLQYIGFEPIGFHVNHQTRFARSVQNAFKHGHPDELLFGIINLGLWWRETIPWLDDTFSRQMIRDSFTAYVENYPPDGPSHVRERVQKVLRFLDNPIPSASSLK
jgi:hypothetical protein